MCILSISLKNFHYCFLHATDLYFNRNTSLLTWMCSKLMSSLVSSESNVEIRCFRTLLCAYGNITSVTNDIGVVVPSMSSTTHCHNKKNVELVEHKAHSNQRQDKENNRAFIKLHEQQSKIYRYDTSHS